MPYVMFGPGTEKIDGSVHKDTYGFLTKLARDDTTPGLHIEPINGSADPRTRTGRVTKFWRAVLVKLQNRTGDQPTYIFLGTYPHDDAIELARTTRVRINPANGIAELVAAQSAPAEPAPVVQAPTPGPASAGPATLRSRSYTVDDFSALGFDADFAAGALDLTDEDAVLDYADRAPAAWQANALLDIYTGASFDTVRDTYRLATPATVPDSNDDAAVLTALEHPAAQMEFALVENDEALRAALANPNFAAWRVFLHPTQRELATKAWPGTARLTGGAGTGKTVILLHRARALQHRDPRARIVLTTFNRTLAEMLKEQLQALDPSIELASDLGRPGIYVAGVDALAYRLLATASARGADPGELTAAVADVLGSRTHQVLGNTWPRAWSAALESVAELPNELRSTAFVEAEYATVVLPNLVTDERGYLKVRRAGRGVALSRARRMAVWSVIEAYRASAAADGSTDFEEKAAVAARLLERSPDARPADHVLVDEAQDLSPARLRLLRALVAEGPDDLLLADDAHQRIYGQRISLSSVGINVRGRRSRRLTLNYRTTEQNLRYALGVLSGTEFVDLDDDPVDSAGYRSARSGPTPRTIPTSSLTDLYDTVGHVLGEWLDAGAAPGSIGLLVPTRKDGETLPRALGERGRTITFVDRDTTSSGSPMVMTMHRAKGMEFAKVILVGVGAANLPRAYQIEHLPEGDRPDALQRERSLLYVAATRARDELVVVYSGEPSELLPG
ncbi:UvrD-helicase domain-containing protein [Skermania piniformis]|uniref:DNA 3'-5' helicase n=1 Tax=Skermania pinensis TaxID=39122 RepID=A0ABX8S575_9ACTN|nr:UvrD-helicase domain-containing protein [Skermania piniformis]QXQ12993.1 AAA family ATPase [Skermania piniformis]